MWFLKKIRKKRELQKKSLELETFFEKNVRINHPRYFLVMGCGRSGTWLLCGLLSTLNKNYLLNEEGSWARFGEMPNGYDCYITKRHSKAYLEIQYIPEVIKFIWIVRHPFDVLTSHNPNTNRRYHISFKRWLGEVNALQNVIRYSPKRALVLKYEDLVTDPGAAQIKLSEYTQLPIGRDVLDYHNSFDAPADAVSAMHGIKPIHKSSLNRWQSDIEAQKYLRKNISRIRREVYWFASTFGYDCKL